MAFTGVAINVAKGGIENYFNTEKIKELRNENKKGLLDGFSSDEKEQAQIKIKEMELLIKARKNIPRELVSSSEKEVIQMLKQQFTKKRETLKEVQATQLDIANVMIEQQVFKRDIMNAVSVLSDNIETISGYVEENTASNGLKNRLDGNVDSDNMDFLFKKIRDFDKRLKNIEKTSKQQAQRIEVNAIRTEQLVRNDEKIMELMKTLSG